ncbi:MAG: hypothetical protein PSX81_06910 [bacterium]|nr:hypothetical protein [bacterium]
MRVKMPIVHYNEKGVNCGRILKKIAIGSMLTFAIIWGLFYSITLINIELKYPFIKNVFPIGVLLSIGLMYFAVAKIGYHNSKYTKIGSLTIGVEGTIVEINSVITELDADAYFVTFTISGYEGENKGIPLIDAGYLLFESGINKIFFSNLYDNYVFNVLVSNAH